MIAMLVILAALQSAGEPNLQIREGHERRGAVLARLDGPPAQSVAACAAACAVTPTCHAWTWRTGELNRTARCDIQAHVTEPQPWPGAVTGLAPAFVARIDAAVDRAFSARERAAARIADGQVSDAPEDNGANDALAGG